jgi:hypothetical protein
MEDDSMTKKLIFSLSFLFVAILLTAGSCGVGPTPKPKLDNLQPTTPLSFSAQVGQSDSKTFSFENTGDATLLYSITKTLNQLDITDSANGTLASGSTATVTVVANCSAVGTFNGSVTVSSSNGGGSGSVDVSLTCTEPPPAGNFDIDLRFIGSNTTPSQQAAFEQAGLRWESIITGDLQHDVQWTASMDAIIQNPKNCDPAAPSLVGETVDDLVIFAKVGPIDGPGGPGGNILAQAGPSLFHDVNENGVLDFGELTLAGCMVFDEDDLDQLVQGGSFTDVVTHEMGHVLGIGTFWDSFFDQSCTTGGGDVGFTGAKSVIEFGTLGETGNPPVEGTQNSDGTDCGHWDEAFFDNELMTGFAESPGTTMPISRLTIASLEDIGYEVDYSLAGTYSIPGCSPSCPNLTTQSVDKPWEKLLKPVGVVNKNGKITLLNQPK